LREPQYNSSADWLRPPEEQEGLKRYVETIRERIWAIIAVLVVTVGIAVVYVTVTPKSYSATADMLISPVSGSDPVLNSLGLIRESSDPTRDVQTAAQLITNIDVARRAARNLETDKTPNELLDEVSAEPVANSNIIAVSVQEPDAAEAATVANTFAKAAVEERTNTLHKEIAERLPRLEAIAENSTEAEAAAASEGTSIDAEIAELEVLAAGPDPTMRVQTEASVPTGPSSPNKKLSLIAGIIAGLVLGLAGAFALQVLDPRLIRESQLRRLYRLPTLARVPKVGRRWGNKPLSPDNASPVVSEAYRTLRATLTRGNRSAAGGGKVILVTGSSPSEGKTTSAVALASSLALIGEQVVLIESDLRRPALGRAFDAKPERGGVVQVLVGQEKLADALVSAAPYDGKLKLLLAETAHQAGWVTDLFSAPGALDLIEQARQLADYVIIDSPPINEVVDALPLAVAADETLLVVRLGRSRIDKLHELGELLAENNVRPSGFIVIGVHRPRSYTYHYANQPRGKRLSAPPTLNRRNRVKSSR
jgi:capsular exopolysaccharide synthesis family protein